MSRRSLSPHPMESKSMDIDTRMKLTNMKLTKPPADYSINKGAKDWSVILYWAAEAGDLKKLKRAVKKGGDINWVNPANGSTPAHVAAWMKRPKVLKYLNKKGANMELKDLTGKTPQDVWEKTKNQSDLTEKLKLYKQKMEERKARKKQQQELADRKKALLGGYDGFKALQSTSLPGAGT